MRKVNETDTAARQVPFFTNSQLHWEFCAVSIVKGFPLIVSPYMSASRARDLNDKNLTCVANLVFYTAERTRQTTYLTLHFFTGRLC